MNTPHDGCTDLSGIDSLVEVPDRPDAVSQILLALAVSSRPVPEDSLADITKIPRQYVAQILASLGTMVERSEEGFGIADEKLRGSVEESAGQKETFVMNRRHYMHWYRSGLPDRSLRLAECASKTGWNNLLYKAVSGLDFLSHTLATMQGLHDLTAYWRILLADTTQGYSMEVYVTQACAELCLGVDDARHDELVSLFTRLCICTRELRDKEQQSVLTAFLAELNGSGDRDRERRRGRIDELAAGIVGGAGVRADGSSDLCEQLLYETMRHFATGDDAERQFAAKAVYEVYMNCDRTLSDTFARYLRTCRDEADRSGMSALYVPEWPGAYAMISCLMLMLSEAYVRRGGNAVRQPRDKCAAFYADRAAQRGSFRAGLPENDIPKLWKAVLAMCGRE